MAGPYWWDDTDELLVSRQRLRLAQAVITELVAQAGGEAYIPDEIMSREEHDLDLDIDRDPMMRRTVLTVKFKPEGV